MSSNRRTVQLLNELELESGVAANPNLVLVFQKTISQSEMRNSISIGSKFCQQVERLGVILIALDNIITPLRSDHRNSSTCLIWVHTARESICCTVVRTFLVDNSILETQQLSENPLLPNCVQALVIKVDQGFLICEDYEFSKLKVRSPLLNCDEFCEILFFICGKALCLDSKRFTNIGCPLCKSTAPTPVCEASVSIAKGLEKSGMPKTGAEHKACCKV